MSSSATTPPAASTAAAWYAALDPGASRTGTAPIASAISRQVRGELVVALDRDRRAVERRERPVEVRERDERVERAGLRPGRHRRLEHLRAEQPAGVDHRLARVQAEAARERLDDVVRARRA